VLRQRGGVVGGHDRRDRAGIDVGQVTEQDRDGFAGRNRRVRDPERVIHAALGGVVYLFVVGGTAPGITTAGLSLALLVMVVLGGAGSLWGAVIGGALYEYLDFRLVALAGSSQIAGLPAWLRVPLGQPLFILGTVFILFVVFFPGGIAAIPARLRTAFEGRARETSAAGESA